MTLHAGKLAGPPPEIKEVRPMTREDLDLIREKRDQPTIQKLRDPHHLVARLLAAGVRPPEVARRSGYSYNRVVTLRTDPAFQELIALYRKDVDEAFKESQDSFYDMATANMLKAERMIAEKLDKADEDEELLPVRDLLAISRDAADRFGYGKRTTKDVNVNHDFASKLEAAIVRSGRAPALAAPSAPVVIDNEPSPLRRRV